jgi:preprotein translocase subunit SecD
MAEEREARLAARTRLRGEAGVLLALLVFTLVGCRTGAPPTAGEVRPAAPRPAEVESPTDALLRPRALHGWIRTILTLEPRAPMPAARLDELVRELARRLEARALRARVIRAGGQIVIGLPEVEPVAQPEIMALLGVQPRFALRMVDDRSPYLAALASRLRPEDAASPHRDSYGGAGGALVSYTTVESERRDALRALVVRERRARRVPADRELLLGPRVGTDGRWVLHLLEPGAVVSGEEVADAQVAADAGSGLPYVMLELTSAGARKLESATRQHVGRRLAIVLNGEVLSAPVIMGPITAGRAQVTLGAGAPDQLLRAARDLALSLRSAVPGPLRLVSVEQR